MRISPEQLAEVADFESLAQFFHDHLSWPRERWSTFGGVQALYDIPKDEIDGIVSLRAVQKLDTEQQWGIFLVDFGPNRLKRPQLRAILNKVAEKARHKHDNPTWPHDNILFVCRSEAGVRFTLAHYTGEKPSTSRLRTIGWSDPRSARTLLDRNLPHLNWQNQAEWSDAWDVEGLTEQFYDDYSAVFQQVKSLTTHPGSPEEKHLFVQSLFNRLMFIAFIERMGWLKLPIKGGSETTDYLHCLHEGFYGRGPSPMDSQTLRDVSVASGKPATGSQAEPRFYDVLRLLFFSALNSPNGTGGKTALKRILGSVPYLNGGLFTPDPVLDCAGVTVDDEAFDIILGPHGLFQRYNFTIQESTHEDIDVAVDPEMLGKIFEELVTGRHESGSYYTPRPVVTFMCREALKGYLRENGLNPTKATCLVDEREEGVKSLSYEEIGLALRLLGEVRVVDPACGSGAYLLGMMRELFELILMLERRRVSATPRELYAVKLDIIQNNLYGVDIDPFAVNIARLRVWLSLAVDHRDGSPEPLPNLKYKFETGDSLISPNPTSLSSQVTGDLFREQKIRDLDELKKEFGKAPTSEEDVRRKTEIEREIDEIRAELRSWYGAKSTAKTGAFVWRAEFGEVFLPEGDDTAVGGFDIVLANPPYVRADAQFRHLLPDKAAQRTAIERWKRYREELKQSGVYETLHEKWDLYIPFLERAHQILADRGQMVFIIPDAFNGNKYATKSHSFFLKNSQIERIDFCSDIPLFKAAVSNTILHFSKQVAASGHSPIRARRWGGTAEDFTRNSEVYAPLLQEEAQGRLFRPLSETNVVKGEGYLPLSHLCYISVGAVLHADEKTAHEAFRLDDLISEGHDEKHPKRLFMGKNMGSWTVLGFSWLEYGTDRAPSQFRRATFPELMKSRKS